MEFPILDEVTRYREMTTTFGGYNHQLSCGEGEFFDMKNMTSEYYPLLSPRKKRASISDGGNASMIGTEDSVWEVSGGYLLHNKVKCEGYEFDTDDQQLVKMGGKIVCFPANVIYNSADGTWENMDNFFTCELSPEGDFPDDWTTPVVFTPCHATTFAELDVKTEEYYKDMENIPNGSYMSKLNTSNITEIKVYSSVLKSWSNFSSSCIKISCNGIGNGFKEGDNIVIQAEPFDQEELNPSDIQMVFPESIPGGSLRLLNTTIIKKEDNAIYVNGSTPYFFSFMKHNVLISRNVPYIRYATECNNRIWGCGWEGNEIYCCKLGDATNWNGFAGISTDAWAATVGSDGLFTGATTFQGSPIFFKEDRLIKVTVSATGAHQLREYPCRGVQSGSHKSLVSLADVLYYKSTHGVCAYTGSVPYMISDAFGDERYHEASAGAIGDRYYISMKDDSEKWHMFVYDGKRNLWHREDDTHALAFANYKGDLYFSDEKGKMYSVYKGDKEFAGEYYAEEDNFEWAVESGNIGYTMPDHKYIARVNIRISLEFGTNVEFYIQYDSNGMWEHKVHMGSRGTRTYTVPVIPRRCDHFKYKIVGKGGCKIHSITKTLEQGSDIG